MAGKKILRVLEIDCGSGGMLYRSMIVHDFGDLFRGSFDKSKNGRGSVHVEAQGENQSA